MVKKVYMTNLDDYDELSTEGISESFLSGTDDFQKYSLDGTVPAKEPVDEGDNEVAPHNITGDKFEREPDKEPKKNKIYTNEQSPFIDKELAEDLDSDYLPYESDDEKEISNLSKESGFEVVEDVVDSDKPSFSSMSNMRGYVVNTQVRELIEYFKENGRKKLSSDRPLFYRNWVCKALLVYVLWNSGRRITEILGSPPFDRSPGLRPCDINYEDKLVTFSILKKNSVMKKNKDGTLRDQDAYKKDMVYKSRYIEQKPLPDDFFRVMKFWITNLKIHDKERIFQFSRQRFDKDLKVACRLLKLKLPGYKYFRVPGTINKFYKKPYYISAHCFRHGYSINFLKKNNTNPAALPVLQKILEHTSINTTKDYLRFDLDDQRSLVNNAADKKNG